MRSNPHQHRPRGPIVQSALVPVENDRGNEKAQQNRADDGGQWPRSRPVKFSNLDAQNAVTDGIAQCANQEYLLQRKNAQNDPLIAVEKRSGNEIAQQPVDQYSYDPAARAGNCGWSGLGKSQPFSRPVLYISAGRSAQPGSKIVSINHTVSLG